MDVDVSAFGNVSDGFADGTAIFKDLFVFGQIAHGDFVTQRDVLEDFHATGSLAFEGHRSGGRALLQIGDCDADVIVVFVQ